VLFVSEYKIAPENRDVAQERFKKTGGAPPQGVKVIGRWHSVVGGRGVTVYEANDAQLIAQWAQQWSDVIICASHVVRRPCCLLYFQRPLHHRLRAARRSRRPLSSEPEINRDCETGF